jgi:hypothetical protein
MFFPQRLRQKEFFERSPMSDEIFLEAIQTTEDFSKNFISCCRSKLGEIFQVDPYKIYPTDTWQDLYNLKCADWEVLEIVFLLEDVLKIEIDEEKVPVPSPRKQLGTWIAEFISRCSPS